MTLALYPWQETVWRQLNALRPNLPHAILLYGPQGAGKSQLAEYFAKTLLCENSQSEYHACGECASCVWFEAMNHPDYRRVRPETLEEAGGEAGEGGAEAGGEGATDTKKAGKAAKTPSKEIKIDQIRVLADFMNLSTHRQGLRVVVLYPAEALNMIAANALLKTLEEPPPGTVFLLVTHRRDRLLPTLLSRCRQIALPLPDHASALSWLNQQGIANAAQGLAEQGGAPLTVLHMAQEGNRDELDWFIQQLMQPSIDSALKTAEKLQKTPVSQLLICLQRWLYDLFSFKLTGTIRYYPRHRQNLAGLAQRLDLTRLLRTMKLMNQRRAIAEHPLAPKLFIEDMLLDYAALYV